MSLARNLERRIEHLVEGLAARVFRGRVHPLEIANRVVRDADLNLVSTPAGPVAPNIYEVLVNPEDVTESAHDLENRLAQVVDEAAQERGWRLEGPPLVTISQSRQVAAGSFEVRSSIERGGLLPWAHLIEVNGGRRFLLRHNRELIGRASRSDIVLGEEEVSRTHALIWREAGRTWVSDMRSSNGTFVRGASAHEPTEVHSGDSVAFGSPRFTYRPA